jgi:hypothetical protein
MRMDAEASRTAAAEPRLQTQEQPGDGLDGTAKRTVEGTLLAAARAQRKLHHLNEEVSWRRGPSVRR